MPWQVYIPALLLGLVSSFHCIGMCGPIALLLPVRELPPKQRLIGVLLYNFGRISTYMMLGIFFGLIGRRVFIAGYQQGFSIILGAIVLAVALTHLLQKRITRNYLGNVVMRNVQVFVARQINRKGLTAMYMVGVGNGLLPCSMVYFAIAGAMAIGTVTGGALFMGAFGLGTLPLMLLLHQFSDLIGLKTRKAIRVSIPYILAMMGVVLIMRGMNLNIPFISPFFSKMNGEAISCH